MDPLLPNNEPAPEITGQGFSRRSKKGQREEVCPSYTAEISQESEDKAPVNNDDAGVSPMRRVLIVFIIVVGFMLAISSLFTSRLRSDQPPLINPSKPSRAIEARVKKLLTENPLIDGHNDLAILIRWLHRNNIYDSNFTKVFEHGGMPYHVDLPRLKKGSVGGAFWSAYVGCPADGNDFSDGNYAEAVASTLSQLDLLHRLTEKYGDVFSTAYYNSSTAAATWEKNHLLISPFSIEGLHQIGNSFSNLRLFHSLNVHLATLTHNCRECFVSNCLGILLIGLL